MTGIVQPYRKHPYAGNCPRWNLEPGTLLARVWNHEDGSKVPFHGTSWNPNRRAQSDTTAGRFDPLPPAPPTGPKGFLYGSESGYEEKVALLETFRSLLWRDHKVSGRNTCSRAERDARTLTIFKVQHPISLLNINTQRGRECFRMDEEVLYVHDRPVTREWGDGVKSQVADAAGIAYNSTRESVLLGLKSFILWEDRVPFKSFDVLDNLQLSSNDGRDKVDKALEDYDIQWI